MQELLQHHLKIIVDGEEVFNEKTEPGEVIDADSELGERLQNVIDRLDAVMEADEVLSINLSFTTKKGEGLPEIEETEDIEE